MKARHRTKLIEVEIVVDEGDIRRLAESSALWPTGGEYRASWWDDERSEYHVQVLVPEEAEVTP